MRPTRLPLFMGQTTVNLGALDLPLSIDDSPRLRKKGSRDYVGVSAHKEVHRVGRSA